MWLFNSRGEKEFKGGKEDWERAVRAAEECSQFKEDVEDELVADERVSCYNCRYRRWTNTSLICLAKDSH